MKKLVVILYVFMLTAAGWSQSIFIEGSDGLESLRQISEGSIHYVSGSDFFQALGGEVRWSSPDARMTAEVTGHKLKFQWDNQFCVVDDTLHNLVYGPVYYIDDLYLPINMLLTALGDRLGIEFVYDRSRRRILSVSPEHNLINVYVEEKLNGTLLEILLSEPLEYELYVTEGNWINISVFGGKVNAAQLAQERPSPKVRRIRAFQFENSAQVSIQMRVKVTDFHHNRTRYPDRIQVSIADEGFMPEFTDTGSVPVESGTDPIDIIVIDPGHGGSFEGAVGKSGLREKEIVLDIALRLEELLDRDSRFTPVLTRRQDHTVALEQRALTANSAKGDLFVSIHTNASPRRNANGCETFFLAAAADDVARVTELLENADFETNLPGGSGSDNDLDYILMDLLQTEYLQQSKLLAETVQSSMRANLNIRSRGVNQAGFAVLNRVSMPSVLVETAFMSNPVEERLLNQIGFRQSVAQAIYDGICNFVNHFEKERAEDVGSQ